jgi:hypothetical protein
MNDHDTMKQIFSSHYYWYTARMRVHMRQVVQCILEALRTGQDLETYAQTRANFWYKGFVFTPCDVFRFDTGGEGVVPPALARDSVRHLHLCRVPLRAVLANWQQGGLWAAQKPLSALLVQTWQARHPAPPPSLEMPA